MGERANKEAKGNDSGNQTAGGNQEHKMTKKEWPWPWPWKRKKSRNSNYENKEPNGNYVTINWNFLPL